MGAMGSRAAYQEAVRRWGKDAETGMDDKDRCRVGTKIGLIRIGRFRIGCSRNMDSGKTWALAFADADKRAGIKKEGESR